MSTSGIIVPNQLCDNFYVVGVDEFLIPENETQFSSTTNSTNLNNNDNNLNENNTPQNQPAERAADQFGNGHRNN